MSREDISGKDNYEEVISPKYRDVMINQCQPHFKQQQSDKQGALLEKIMEKLTSFSAKDRTLKKFFSMDLQSFQVRELYLHAVYSVLFSERVWHKEELLYTLSSSLLWAIIEWYGFETTLP